MENRENIAENWIVNHLTGEATTAEEQQLQAWVAESSDNEKLFEEFKKGATLGEQHYKTDSSKSLNIDVNSEWVQFNKNIERNQETKVVPIARETTNYNWFKVAAAVILIIGVGFVVNYFSGQQSLTQYQTAQNTQEIILPDGSTVTLNSHSSLSYSEDFGEADRSVNLDGEAFFDVTKDKEKSFIITTQKAQVQVLGTSFNVRAYGQGEKAEVIVATGVVKFSKNNSADAVTLNAGDKGVLHNNKLEHKVNEDVNFLSWKTRKLVFEEEPLGSVLETLSRVYNVSFSQPNPSSHECEITVTFDQQTIESVLNVLKTTLDLEYHIDGDKIEITAIGC